MNPGCYSGMGEKRLDRSERLPLEAMQTDASVFGKPPCLGCKTSVLNTRAKLERRPLRLRTGLSISPLAHGIAAQVEGLAGNNVSKY